MSSFGGSFAILAEVVAGTTFPFGGAFSLLGTGRFASTFGGDFATLQPPDVSAKTFGGLFRVLGKDVSTQPFGGRFTLNEQVEQPRAVVRWVDGEWLALPHNRWVDDAWVEV